MLKRPPARSLDRSSFNLEMAVDRPVLRVERSNGSSVAAAAGLGSASELELPFFAALSFFLYSAGELAKLRLWRRFKLGLGATENRRNWVGGRH